MAWNQWKQWWQSALIACENCKGDIRPLKIKPPVKDKDIEKVEKKLGIKIPDSFGRILLEFSSGINFSWFLPDDFNLPQEFDEIFSGGCSWDIVDLIDLEKNRQGWIKECFPDPNDDYDNVWHDKLAFLHVPNGDMIGIDLNKSDGPVVYMSHEDSEGHGNILGRNFIDFIDRWSRLGCPGPEDWQMMPFIADQKSCLDPNSNNAKRWRNIFGLRID